jgi:hypothetical protein
MIQAEFQGALAENKREMFDGMRAYHESEIKHSDRAVTMLLAIAGAAGAVVMAILFPKDPPHHTVAIAWDLWIVVATFALTIAATAHAKINSDHAVYATFGEEYVKTASLLGFYNPLELPGHEHRASIKKSHTIGRGKGYRQTQLIIWSFASLLIALTLCFAIVVTFAM